MIITEAEYLRMLARLKGNARPENIPDDGVEEESDLHEFIMADCRANGWGYIHSRMDKKSTINEGAADFIIFADRGRVLVIECKSRTGKLRPAQLGFSIQLELKGHTVHCIRSKTEYLALAHPTASSSP